jgi:hypothetical protein
MRRQRRERRIIVKIPRMSESAEYENDILSTLKAGLSAQDAR